MSLTKLPMGRNNSVMTSLFPPRECLVVTSRLGTGNLRTFFYGVLYSITVLRYRSSILLNAFKPAYFTSGSFWIQPFRKRSVFVSTSHSALPKNKTPNTFFFCRPSYFFYSVCSSHFFFPNFGRTLHIVSPISHFQIPNILILCFFLSSFLSYILIVCFFPSTFFLYILIIYISFCPLSFPTLLSYVSCFPRSSLHFYHLFFFLSSFFPDILIMMFLPVLFLSLHSYHMFVSSFTLSFPTLLSYVSCFPRSSLHFYHLFFFLSSFFPYILIICMFLPLPFLSLQSP